MVDLRKDAEGADIGYVAITQDITERLEAERERLHLVEVEAAHAEAEVARGRFAFLAEASSLLTASLDVDLTLAALTRFVIPVLADVCVVDLIDDESQEVRRVAVAHVVRASRSTSGQRARAMRDLRRWPACWGVLYSEIAEEHLPEVDAAPDAQAVIRALRIGSSLH